MYEALRESSTRGKTPFEVYEASVQGRSESQEQIPQERLLQTEDTREISTSQKPAALQIEDYHDQAVTTMQHSRQLDSSSMSQYLTKTGSLRKMLDVQRVNNKSQVTLPELS